MHAKFFVGMPTPAAASAVLIPVLLQVSKREWMLEPYVVIAYTILIAVLMVSRIPMFSFKKLKLPRPVIVPLLVVIGLIVVGVRKDLWLTLACMAGAYVLSLPLAWWMHHTLAKQAALEGGEEEAQPAATAGQSAEQHSGRAP
jgi:CDP-diacylglycerol--serine O-phosphatidyltransferase